MNNVTCPVCLSKKVIQSKAMAISVDGGAVYINPLLLQIDSTQRVFRAANREYLCNKCGSGFVHPLISGKQAKVFFATKKSNH